jgi:predicted DNA-binding transcriptional regulator YafY
MKDLSWQQCIWKNLDPLHRDMQKLKQVQIGLDMGTTSVIVKLHQISGNTSLPEMNHFGESGGYPGKLNRSTAGVEWYPVTPWCAEKAESQGAMKYESRNNYFMEELFMRGKNIIKLLKVVDLLSNKSGVTKFDICNELRINDRSVYRIINTIEELGFPVYDDRSHPDGKTRWKLEETYLKKLPNLSIPDVRFTFAEIIALFLLKSQGASFKGTDLEKNILTAFQKLSLYLPDDAVSRLQKIQTLFVSAAKFAKDYTGKQTIIDQLTSATLKQTTCLVTYHAFYDDTVKHFKIDPLHFFEKDGGLYVLVRTPSFDSIRMLAVERIQQIETTDTQFDYPDDFDPETQLIKAFDLVMDDPVEAKIWFSKDQARYIKERHWSNTQKITDNPDGSIILEMTTSGVWDVKKWVLSFGAHAMVLAPDVLKNDIMAELITAREQYSSQ